MLQNLATKKILGVFKTAPIIPRELESALVPPNIRLNHNSRRYIFRALKLSNTHPIKLEVNKAIAGIRDELDRPQGYNTRSKTQIESLVRSIYDTIDLTSLEKIRHFYFGP